MLAAAAGVYDLSRRGRPSREGCGDRGTRRFRVFSFVGVLGITLVLFLVVALTARLILGR
ncbi:MAG: hypothetical protein ACKOZU_04885 [Planctomycetaceae bacterium]